MPKKKLIEEMKFCHQHPKELPAIKKRLLEKLPKLSYNEVRRAKIPFYEAIKAELLEDGHTNSFEIFGYLLTVDEEISQKNPTAKRLIKSNKNIEKLAEKLKKAEEYSKINDKDGEVRIFQETIEEFSSGTKDFYWIADEFYKVLINKSQDLTNIGNARLNFQYANFLRNKIGNLEKAADYYKTAKDSFGNFRSSLFQLNDLVFYKEIVKNFCGILIELAQISSKKYSGSALKYIQQASDLSDENPHHTSEFFIKIANFYFKLGKFDEALKYHLKVLDLEADANDEILENYCLASLKTGICYKELDQLEEAKRYLDQACNIAKINNFLEYLADAHMSLGQISIDEQRFSESELLLETASKLYNNLGLHDKERLAGILKAPVLAQKTFNHLVDRILRADKGTPGDNLDLERLRKWYERRVPIWIPKEDEQVPREEIFIQKYLAVDEITHVDINYEILDH